METDSFLDLEGSLIQEVEIAIIARCYQILLSFDDTADTIAV